MRVVVRDSYVVISNWQSIKDYLLYNKMAELMQNLTKEVTKGIYPSLMEEPSAPGIDAIHAGSSFRLEKIDKIQKELDTEREMRMQLSKKYHRAIKGVQAADEMMIVTSMGLGVAGIGVLSTIIAAPIAIAMEVAALGIGLLSVVGTEVSKRLILKAEKHDRIKTMAETKLNTISDHVSRALRDGVISDEEYTDILDELQKFKVMKEETRSKIKVGIDEATKQSFIEQGKQETMTSFQRMFGKGDISNRLRASFSRG